MIPFNREMRVYNVKDDVAGIICQALAAGWANMPGMMFDTYLTALG